MLNVQPRFRPPLEPNFLPAALWDRAFRTLVDGDASARPFALVLVRSDGGVSRHDGRLLGPTHASSALNLRHAERLLKFLLWQKGGCRVLVAGADDVADYLAHVYSPAGARAFDYDFMGEKVYGRTFSVEKVAFASLPAEQTTGLALGRHLDGCRIGFDLGGSDRKVAAMIDGQVVFSEEVTWDPYFQKDPAYHLGGVYDALQRAAAHLPRVDAIGGSAAGIYVRNEVRVASLFRGVPSALFEREIRPMFFTLQQRWGGIPFEVANDGEVAALAGAMTLGDNAVLGVSMGTSMAGGYITPSGKITPWLNELAFVPVDYRPDAPCDEWSGDAGCGVQYFSQQGVARFAKTAGFEFADDTPAAERLVAVQQAMATGDARARAIYETIGTCFGYALGQFGNFYELRHLLLLGRVTSGAGGAVILEQAGVVLREEFPSLAAKLRLHLPGEKDRRHGQAIAAASLPSLKKA